MTIKQAIQSGQSSLAPHGLPFPVVGIGALAGGYAALTTLLQNMPSDSGMAFVVILHLASDEPSAADKLLQRASVKRRGRLFSFVDIQDMRLLFHPH